MKYTVKPGIAACVDVECEKFEFRFGQRVESYVYLSKENGIVKAPGSKVEFEALPSQVQEAIKNHFDHVFSLPLEKREKGAPFNVEA